MLTVTCNWIIFDTLPPTGLDSHLQLLLDPLVLLGLGDAGLLAAQVQLAHALVGELGAGLGVVLVVLVVVLVLGVGLGVGLGGRRRHHRRGVLQLLLGLLQVALSRERLATRPHRGTEEEFGVTQGFVERLCKPPAAVAA